MMEHDVEDDEDWLDAALWTACVVCFVLSPFALLIAFYGR